MVGGGKEMMGTQNASFLIGEKSKRFPSDD